MGFHREKFLSTNIRFSKERNMKSLVLAAAVAVSMSASAHDVQIDLSQRVKETVTSGIDSVLGFELAEQVVQNVMDGGSCVRKTRDGQDDMEMFFKRDQKSVTCVILMGEQTAFIVVDYATKGVVRTLVLGGDVLHKMGSEIGAPIRQDGQRLLKKSGEWTRRHTGVFTFWLGALPATIGLSEFVAGGIIEGAGEAGYYVLNGVANRVDVTVKNLEGVVHSATLIATEAATLEPANSVEQAGATIGYVVQTAHGLLYGKNKESLQRKIEKAGYSVSLK
jgi:hypothetical protein